MAGQVVESMADDFHPERFHDTYQEQLQELVEAKLEGGEAFATEEQPAQLDETEDVSDLLAKLEASVRRRREQSGDADAEGRSERPGDTAAQEGTRQESSREEGAGQEGSREHEGRRSSPAS